MDQDYSKYSIPELQQSLASVDEEKFPENKAALEQELRARKNSGELDRFVQEARESEKQQALNTMNFARKMRKVIAGYLVTSALYAFAGIGINGSSVAVGGFALVFLGFFLVASFVGGIGLFLDKPWGHWTAVTVLALQVVKIQLAGFVFSLLSLVGIYVYAATDWEIGISATFDPGFVFAVGSNVPSWIGVNIFVVPLIVYLITAREQAS